MVWVSLGLVAGEVFIEQISDVFSLVHSQFVSIMILFELNTNEFGDGTHFFDPKILMNLLLDPEQEGRGVECFHSIINVKSNDADDASA